MRDNFRRRLSGEKHGCHRSERLLWSLRRPVRLRDEWKRLYPEYQASSRVDPQIYLITGETGFN
jgi:hypothetical protein